MKLIITLIFFHLLSSNAISQEVEHVKTQRYSGYIFPTNANILLGIQGQSDKFTPDKKAIEKFEYQLTEKIKELTKDLPDQGKGCPNINKRHLRKYIRQYFGFIVRGEDKVLFVNFVWSKGIGTNKLDKNLVSVLDGCTRYWSIQYNITKDYFYNLVVNIKS
jgi:hypothetical protein